MRKVGKVRKAIVTAVGMAVTLVLLLPQEQMPEAWRPYVGIVLALGTVLGVYRVHNDRPVTREDLARKIDYMEKPRPPRRDDLADPPQRRVRGDKP